MAGRRYSPIEMLRELVAFDTTSRNSNLALIDFVADYLADHGIAATRLHNAEGSKANLYATLGPERPGGVVLSGHTDVVPVDGQDWSDDPFRLAERDGRLYGRGAADMKGFLACVLAMAPDFLAARPNIPVHLALSYDEEVGCLGARDLVAHMAAHLPRPAAVVIGEPTEMKVVNAHKGIRSFRTVVTGHEAHSSNTHLGVNAIMVAAELIQYLSRLAEEMRARGDPSGRFDPPYTTVHVGTIEGGTAVNIVPRRCSFAWEYRLLPDQDEDEIRDRFLHFAAEEVLARLRANAPESAREIGIETRPRSNVPGLKPRADSPAEALACLLTGANHAEAVSYGTEAGIFDAADIPAVVCGPGSIRQAHRPDEFIAVSEIDACMAFLHRLRAHVGAGG